MRLQVAERLGALAQALQSLGLLVRDPTGRGAVAELTTARMMEHRLGELSRSYKEGDAGTYDKLAQGLTIAGAALMAAAGRRRLGAVASGGLLLAGAVCKRWSTFKACFASAEDPHQTVGPQRDRLEARKREAEIDGPAISG